PPLLLSKVAAYDLNLHSFPTRRSSDLGYWIAAVDIANMDGYRGYITANKAVFDKYGARFLVRGGERTVVEGHCRDRIVVIEFERSEEHTSELQSRRDLVCRLLLEKKK